MRKFSKQQILRSIKILDLAEDNALSLEQISSGNFTHRCKCPSEEHKSGLERTGSLYIDGDNNNFYCFGCGASNNVIDFYMLCNSCDFSTAITELSDLIDPKEVSSADFVPKKNNFQTLLKISNMFRKAQQKHPEDLEWIESVMLRTDIYMQDIDRYDTKKAKALAMKVYDILKRRFS